MERSFNRVRKAVDALERDLAALEALKGQIGELEEYQASGLWMEDFEADERGELPADMRRGVLSEDALYNLFEDINNLKSGF
jgi:hypothetical protein